MTYFVYVIATVRTEDVLDEPVKIGITGSPAARLTSMRTGNPEPLHYAALFCLPEKVFARNIERIAHEVLDEFNVTGKEWFVVHPSRASLTVQRAIVEAAKYLDFDPDHCGRNIA